jgi:hypothetical protein
MTNALIAGFSSRLPFLNRPLTRPFSGALIAALRLRSTTRIVDFFGSGAPIRQYDEQPGFPALICQMLYM